MAANSRSWKASAIVAVLVAAMTAVMVEGNYSVAMEGRRAIIDHIKGNNAAVRAGLCQVRDELIQESAPWREWTMLKIHDGLSFQHSASATSDGKENSTTPEPTDGACDKLKGKAKDKSYEAANAARQPQ